VQVAWAAQQERDRRDTVKIALLKIAEAQDKKKAADLAKLQALDEALAQGVAGMKKPTQSSINAYTPTTRRIQRWAERSGVAYISDVTLPIQVPAISAAKRIHAGDLKHHRKATTTKGTKNPSRIGWRPRAMA